MYKLTGVKKKEFTDATTTGLINCRSLEFDKEIWDTLGFPEELRRSTCAPGELVGRLKPELEDELGGNLDVVFCATHDTASAVEAIEMETNSP